MLQTPTTFMNRPEQAPERASAEAVASLGRGAGLVLSLAGLIGWIGWLSWRFATLEKSIVAVGVLTLGLVAISAALVVTAGLFAGRPQWRRGRRATDAARPRRHHRRARQRPD